ncbi:MAG: hypothetical protein WC613_05415 [Candidatus Aenigmatarchaeota archaeon]
MEKQYQSIEPQSAVPAWMRTTSRFLGEYLIMGSLLLSIPFGVGNFYGTLNARHHGINKQQIEENVKAMRQPINFKPDAREKAPLLFYSLKTAEVIYRTFDSTVGQLSRDAANFGYDLF